jgi:L-aminopeptidase/D-esterase-like protein
MHLVESVNAVVLAGGSAYGLAAADGVMRYLEEQTIGYRLADGKNVVPIVPAAILMDLTIGKSDVRPGAAMGYAACLAATDGAVEQGTVGAGTGCRVGFLLGNENATKGGIGSSSIDLGDGLVVSALMAVNAIGDVIDSSGHIIAGLREIPQDKSLSGTMALIRSMARITPPISHNATIIGVVATNAKLTKEQVNKVAQMAHNGIAQAVRPAHTMYDGDTIFALATGQIPANVNAIGAFAAEAVAQSIRNAVLNATSLAGVKSLKD